MIPYLTDSCVTCSSFCTADVVDQLALYYFSQVVISMRAMLCHFFVFSLANKASHFQENVLNEIPLETIVSAFSVLLASFRSAFGIKWLPKLSDTFACSLNHSYWFECVFLTFSEKTVIYREVSSSTFEPKVWGKKVEAEPPLLCMERGQLWRSGRLDAFLWNSWGFFATRDSSRRIKAWERLDLPE